jgi:hypothetical protein
MKKKSHKRMQMGGMAKMDDAAGRAMMKDLRGSRGAPMVAKTMSPQEGSAMIRNLRGSRGGRGAMMSDIIGQKAPREAMRAEPVQRDYQALESNVMKTAPDSRGEALAAELNKNAAMPMRRPAGGRYPLLKDAPASNAPVAQPKVAAPSATMVGRAAAPISDGRGALASTLSLNKGVPAMKKGGVVKSKKMRGGGLARKGVGMALAKGGLAKRAGGCAKRGVGRGKMV